MGELHGWAGKILRIDLTTGEQSYIDTGEYVPKYIGGIGVAYRIAWEEVPKGTGAFDPENRLFMMVGPLTGTSVPYSGRAEIVAIGAQGYPEQLVCSGIGGHWPARLKWNGFDGIVFQGKSPVPVYLLIRDGSPEVIPAGHLWGLGVKDIQKEFQKRYGKDVDSYIIGPAGENLVRFASVLNASGGAAGQGGMGAVMGSKNLKAVVIAGGNSKITMARPQEVLNIRAEIQPQKIKCPIIDTHDVADDVSFSYYIAEYANQPFSFRRVCCSSSCAGGCFAIEHKDVPSLTRPGTNTSRSFCMGVAAQHYQNRRGNHPEGFRGSFEVTTLIDQYGLNELELLFGIVPWLCMAKEEGLDIEERLGFPIDKESADFWLKLLKVITYREGFGDLLAEGTYRTIRTLGQEKYGNTVSSLNKVITGFLHTRNYDLTNRIDCQGGWGYTSRLLQWEQPIQFGMLGGLKWLIDTRDPHHDKWYDPAGKTLISIFSEKDPYTCDVLPNYAAYTTRRGHLISSLTLCWVLPLSQIVESVVWPTKAQDVEARLFSAVTGLDYTEEELTRVGDTINNLFRAFCIRNHDRTAEMEWNTVVPNMSKNPKFESDRFRKTAENFYKILGWDPKTGWPTRETYEAHGLKDIADELQVIGKLP